MRSRGGGGGGGGGSVEKLKSGHLSFAAMFNPEGWPLYNSLKDERLSSSRRLKKLMGKCIFGHWFSCSLIQKCRGFPLLYGGSIIT